MDKGKAKLIQEDDSDTEFDPNVINESFDQESQDESEDESESEQDSAEDSELDYDDPENELQDLLQEAQEYGDGGDMVDGLRSGKYRLKPGFNFNTNASNMNKDKAESSSSGKRAAEESVEQAKKINKCP